MKNKFSLKWKASKQPRKQRKFLANAPLHIKHKLLGSHLSKELKKKYNRRAIPVRKGDLVKVMRGKFKGKKGKVNGIDINKRRVNIEGLQVSKRDGTKVNSYFSSSNLQVEELNLDDKKRLNILNKQKKPETKEEKNAPEKK